MTQGLVGLLIEISVGTCAAATGGMAFVMYTARKQITDPFFRKLGWLMASICLFCVMMFVGRLYPNTISRYSRWNVACVLIGTGQLAVFSMICIMQFIAQLVRRGKQ